MDLFDEPLSLEQKFYDEGYKLGSDDGSKAGRTEGRVFGLEKGFEKYVEAGRLHGRSIVWASRLPGLRAINESTTQSVDAQSTVESRVALPDLANNPRLEKHVRVLYALTEPVSLDTENTEDAVSDFDDRLKRALGKVKIIERLVGEGSSMRAGEGETALNRNPQHVDSTGETNIEDVSVLKARH